MKQNKDGTEMPNKKICNYTTSIMKGGVNNAIDCNG